jgi:hypothetical protein
MQRAVMGEAPFRYSSFLYFSLPSVLKAFEFLPHESHGATRASRITPASPFSRAIY